MFCPISVTEPQRGHDLGMCGGGMGGALCVVVRLHTEANYLFFDNNPNFHNFFHFYFMYMGALSASMPMYHVCAVHEEARRGC